MMKKKKLVIDTIIQKINILIQGAKKRNNQDVLAEFTPKFIYWKNMLKNQNKRLN